MTANVTDGRVAAWCSAWQLLESANVIRQKIGNDQMPPMYHAIMDEAALYAQLVTAPTEVGFVTGSWLQDRWDARVEAETTRTASMFENFFDQKKREDGDDE